MLKEKKDAVLQTVRDVRSQWKVPGKGNYVSYKEILNLGVGGMGQQCVILIIGCLSLGAGNTLLGATLGLKPLHLQYMSMIQTVLNLIFYVIRGKIVDNTKTRFGRFRPYIAIMGFPIVILTAVFIFLPFETMSYTKKLLCTFLFAIAISMVSPLFTDTYSELTTVITPNSGERAKIVAINSLLYSFAPTIYYAVIPILADKLGGYTDIRTYRYVYVPIAIIGVGLNLFTAFGCKERIVTSQSYKPKVSMWEGVTEIWRNKHWWIRNIAGYIGFLESACTILFSWIYIYGTQDMASYAVLTTVLGSASGIAMAITPWLLKKLGNKRLLISHNLLNVAFVAMMTFTYKIPILLFVFIYLNSLVNALALVYNQVMHSEVKDYQQYISGKRMDFTFGAAGLIGTPITMLTGLVIPYVYECMGITTNYDILYDPAVRNNIFYVLCILSIIGAVLNLVPFMFYDLSREKHQNIIRVLYYRSVYDDYTEGVLSDETIVRTVENIRQGIAFLEAPAPDIAACKAAVKEAKKQPRGEARKEAVKAAKAALKDAKQLAVEKDAAKILKDELEKYDTYFYRVLLSQAREICKTPIERVADLDVQALAASAAALPDGTKEERKAKKAADKTVRAMEKTVRMAKKLYPDGVVRPDPNRLQAAIALPQETKEEKNRKREALHAAEQELLSFNKALKTYLNTEELLRRGTENKQVYHEVEKIYDSRLAPQAKQTAAAE